MPAFLKATLRMRPDRILVGEVRGAEALDLLDAWNTGHEGGAATLHANNAAAGLARLRSLITRNESAPAEIEPLIGEVVHVVVHIARTPEGVAASKLEVSWYVTPLITKPLGYFQCKRLFSVPSLSTARRCSTSARRC
jgi:type IV secretion system protein VirB11